MSFRGTLQLVASSHESFRSYAGKPTRQGSGLDDLLEICASKQIKVGPLRTEQRGVKRKPKNYPLLSVPRHEYEEVFHRSRYFRKGAKTRAIRD